MQQSKLPGQDFYEMESSRYFPQKFDSTIDLTRSSVALRSSSSPILRKGFTHPSHLTLVKNGPISQRCRNPRSKSTKWWGVWVGLCSSCIAQYDLQPFANSPLFVDSTGSPLSRNSFTFPPQTSVGDH